jgi:hypothetical protein
MLTASGAKTHAVTGRVATGMSFGFDFREEFTPRLGYHEGSTGFHSSSPKGPVTSQPSFELPG